jgi:hypothetical protein
MSTVVIGGGDGARSAIEALETASLGMTNEQREDAETLLKQFTADAQARCEGC